MLPPLAGSEILQANIPNQITEAIPWYSNRVSNLLTDNLADVSDLISGVIEGGELFDRSCAYSMLQYIRKFLKGR